MAANYPTSLPVKQTAGANLSTAPGHSVLHDDMYDEIVAIGTELGTSPKGTKASVKARLDASNTDVFGSNFTTITAASGYSATLASFRWGAVGIASVTVTRTGSNVGATTGLVATIASGGRGSFSAVTQALPMRSRSDSTLIDTLCWVDMSNGQISMQWFNTWTTGASMTFNGMVVYGL